MRRRLAVKDKARAGAEAAAAAAAWKCRRCGTDNHMKRDVCRKCSWRAPPLEERGRPEDPLAEPVTFRRKGKRAGVKHQKLAKKKRLKRKRRGIRSTRGGAAGSGPHPPAVRAVKARGDLQGFLGSRGRRPTGGEEAQSGNSRKAGAGSCRSPMAHLAHTLVVKGFSWVAASACCWEAWHMLRTAREQAEALLTAVSETGTGVLVTAGVTAEDVLAAAARLVKAAGHGMEHIVGRCVHIALMIMPVLMVFSLILCVQQYMDWLEGLKARFGRTGRNLEGNVESKSIQKLKERFENAERQEIPWMTPTSLRGHIRRFEAAVDLYCVGSVKKVSAGAFEVESATTDGVVYLVELDLKGNDGTFKGLVKSCACKDFIHRGPGCKHLGAVLLGLVSQEDPAGSEASSKGAGLEPVALTKARAAEARPGEVPRRVQLRDQPRGDAAGSAFEPPARRAGVRTFVDLKHIRTFAGIREKAERLRDAVRHEGSLREWKYAAIADAPSSSSAADLGVAVQDGPKEPGLGKVVEFLDGVSSQERAIEMITKAKEFVILFAFTFDRADVAHALLAAQARGCKVAVGVDKRWTLNGKTRDQLSRLQELASQGVDVRVLVGTAYDVEYRAVQRPTFGGVGLQHSKAVHTDVGTIVGSCNFTTASRANRELGVLLQLDAKEVEVQRRSMSTAIAEGMLLRDAEKLAEQRGHSPSPRGRSLSHRR